MRYQQNLAGRKITIVVLGQQQWPRLRPHIQRVIEAVNAAIPAAMWKWTYQKGHKTEPGSK
jgi:hypothetical protein